MASRRRRTDTPEITPEGLALQRVGPGGKDDGAVFVEVEPNRSDVGAAVGPGGGQLPGSRAFGEKPVVLGFVHDVHGRTSSHLKTVVTAPR